MKKTNFEDNLRNAYISEQNLDLDAAWDSLESKRNPKKSRRWIFFLLFPGIVALATGGFFVLPAGSLNFWNVDKLKAKTEGVSMTGSGYDQIPNNSNELGNKDVVPLLERCGVRPNLIERKGNSTNIDEEITQSIVESTAEQNFNPKRINKQATANNKIFTNQKEKIINESNDRSADKTGVTSSPKSLLSDGDVMNENEEKSIAKHKVSSTIMNIGSQSEEEITTQIITENSDRTVVKELNFLQHFITFHDPENLTLPMLAGSLSDDISPHLQAILKNEISLSFLAGFPQSKFSNISSEQLGFVENRQQTESYLDVFGAEMQYTRRLNRKFSLSLGAGYTQSSFLSQQNITEFESYTNADTTEIIEYQNGSTAYILDSVMKTSIINQEVTSFHKYSTLYIPFRASYIAGISPRSTLRLTAGLDYTLKDYTSGRLIQDTSLQSFSSLKDLGYSATDHWAAAFSLDYSHYFRGNTGVRISVWTKHDLSSRHLIEQGYDHRIQSYGLSLGLFRGF